METKGKVFLGIIIGLIFLMMTLVITMSVVEARIIRLVYEEIGFYSVPIDDLGEIRNELNKRMYKGNFNAEAIYQLEVIYQLKRIADALEK